MWDEISLYVKLSFNQMVEGGLEKTLMGRDRKFSPDLLSPYAFSQGMDSRLCVVTLGRDWMDHIQF